MAEEEPGIKGLLPDKDTFRPHRRDVGAQNWQDALRYVAPHRQIHNYNDVRPAAEEVFRTDVPSPSSAMFKATPPTTSVVQRAPTKKPAYQTGIPRQGGDVMPTMKEWERLP